MLLSCSSLCHVQAIQYFSVMDYMLDDQILEANLPFKGSLTTADWDGGRYVWQQCALVQLHTVKATEGAGITGFLCRQSACSLPNRGGYS